MKPLHNLLRRQLRRLGPRPRPGAGPPTRGATLLDQVSQSYGGADQERYLLERSQDISSREMQELQRCAPAPARHAGIARARPHRGARGERGAVSELHLARFRLVLGAGRRAALHRDQRQLRRSDRLLGRRASRPRALGSARRRGAGRRLGAPARAARIARDVLRRRAAARPPGARRRRYAAISGEPVFDARRPFHRLPRHRARSDAADAGRGKHQPARALRHADQSLQPRRVLRARSHHALSIARRHGARARRAVHRPRPLQGRQRRASATSPATRC